MSTTVGLSNMPSSTTDVAVAFLNQVNLRERKSSQQGNQISTEYVYASGDPTYETSVLVTSALDEKNNVLRSSISLRTVQTVTVDSVVTEVDQVIASLSWTTPGRTEDTTQVLAMLGTLYSLAFNGVTSKVPNTGTIDAINRGITEGLFS
jgi:hypothetical protein